MSTIDNPHPHHAAHLAWGAAATTLVLTLAYHYFLAGRYYGFGLAIFVFILVIAMHGMAVLSGRSGNSWAYVFLLPALLGIAAEVMYANSVVRIAAPFLIALSLAFFSYWLMAPKITMREVRGLWPQSFFLEAIIPAEGGGGMLSGFSFGKHWKRMLIGCIFAVPFLFVFGSLFASADPLFRKTLSEFFHLESLPELFLKVVRDVAVAFFLGRYLWSMLSRAIQQRKPKFIEWQMPVDRVVIYTFLGLLNALFLLFIGFQFVYFFGGHDLIQQQLGITYADYAHEGFFQLLAVSALVFGISWFIYLQTEMKQWGTRGLAFALIAQTGIVIASAVRRLLLYVDAYGLTVLRLWALIGIFFIALILLILVVSALTKRSYGTLAKTTLLVSLYVFAGLLLVNTEAMTVNFNAARYLAHGKDRIDVAYFETLSSDAVPAMVAFQKAHGSEPLVAAEYNVAVSVPVVDKYNQGSYGYQTQQVQIHHFIDELRSRRSTLQAFVDADWRNAVWSDRAALNALSSLQ